MFVSGKKIVKFKAADSQIVPYLLCLENISKDFNSTNSEKTELFRYVYHFSVNYRAIANDKIQDIHAYLMKKKKRYYKMFKFIKKYWQ